MLSKHFIRYNVQYFFFFLNKKEKKGEKNLLKKKLIFLSIDFDNFFLSRGHMSVGVHDKKRKTIRENGYKRRTVSFFFLSSVHARMKI